MRLHDVNFSVMDETETLEEFSKRSTGM